MKQGRSEVDLFGQEVKDTPLRSEYILECDVLDNTEEIYSRIECFETNIVETGNLMLEYEDFSLLADARRSYYYGMFSGCILCSLAFCERILTDAIEIRGDRNSSRSGFGKIISAVENKKMIHPFIIERLSHLNRARVNLSHEKGPDHEYTLLNRFKRRPIFDQDPNLYFMKNDARDAVSIAHGLAAKFKRNFPRLELPGHPSIKEEILAAHDSFFL